MPKTLTLVLATKLSTYPLVTISRRVQIEYQREVVCLGGKDVGPDVSQDGGDGGARAPQRAGRSVGRGHRRHPQGVTGHARYVV